MRPRIALLDLRDLSAYPWQPHRLDGHLESLALVAEPPAGSFRAFEPPPCLIVVGEGLFPEVAAAYRGWLSGAARLICVREWAADDTSLADPEMAELVDVEWRDALGGASTTVIDRRGADPEPLRRALAAARAAVPALPDWRPDAASSCPTASLEAGRWLTLRGPRFWSPPLPGEIAHDGRTAFLFEAARQIPLDGAAPIVDRGATRPVSPTPDRTGYLACPKHHEGELRAADDRLVRSFVTYGMLPYGFDPRWPLAWTGHRMSFYWHLVRDGGATVLSPAAHDWPCGHAKKLFGYDDNYPRWIHLAPRADAYLSAFDHDVMVSAAVPMHWELRDGVALARRPAPDPLRALLFTSDAEQRATWNVEPPEEDARAEAPVVVLGASDEVRYAVGLERETYRLRGEALEPLSAGEGGFAVYDAAHALVRRAPGRLLGGWDGVATVEHEGALFREDLASGRRRALGASDRPIARALPLAGTENVLLVSDEAAVKPEPGEAVIGLRVV
jgi:hypothetical protein